MLRLTPYAEQTTLRLRREYTMLRAASLGIRIWLARQFACASIPGSKFRHPEPSNRLRGGCARSACEISCARSLFLRPGLFVSLWRMILLPSPTGSSSAENAPTSFFTSCSTDSGHTLAKVLIGTTESLSRSASRPRSMGAVSGTPICRRSPSAILFALALNPCGRAIESPLLELFVGDLEDLFQGPWHSSDSDSDPPSSWPRSEPGVPACWPRGENWRRRDLTMPAEGQVRQRPVGAPGTCA